MPSPNAIPLWGQWISHIRQTIKQRAAVKLSTDALLLSLEELGNHGGYPGGTPSNPNGFASVDELIPSADVDKLLHSSQLLKQARKCTLKHTNHYMEFYTALSQVVEHAQKPLPQELEGFVQQHRQQKLLLEAVDNNDVQQVHSLIPTAHPKSNKTCALRNAAKKGHTQCVAALIAVSCFEFDEHIAGALQLSAENGHSACVALLLPNTHLLTYPSACRKAAWAAHKNIVQTLLPLVDHAHSQGILAAAAKGGDIDIVHMVEQQFPGLDCAEALKAASVAGHPQCVDYLVGKTTAHDIADALRELSAGPGLYGRVKRNEAADVLQWTSQQQQCAHTLIAHCNASDVLHALQTQFPNEPWNWRDLEEQLWDTQRIILEQAVEHTPHASVRRKM